MAALTTRLGVELSRVVLNDKDETLIVDGLKPSNEGRKTLEEDAAAAIS